MRRRQWLGLAALVAVGAAACGGGGEEGGAATTSAPAATAGATTTTAAVAAPEDQMVDVSGHRLHVVCQGTGPPTVLVEMGAGQKVTAWNGLQPELAATYRTCVYERAGIGESEPGPEPRTAQQIVDELEALMEGAGIDTPVILVSHSAGGLYAQLFASEHADQVVGLVFLDPRTAEYQRGYRDNLTAEELSADAADLANVIASEPFGPEIEAFDISAQQVTDAGGLPDVPVVVLTAGVTFPGQSQADIDFWRQTHADLAAQVTAGRQAIVDGAEHEIWRTHPEAVIDAVNEVAGA